MSGVLKVLLSISFSGGLLILILLLGKRLWKDKISRQWQYYIWLVIVLRLLLPFGPEVGLLGKTYQAVGQAITQAAPMAPQLLTDTSGDRMELESQNANRREDDFAVLRPLQDMGALLSNHVWIIWLAAALGLLIRKITIYQGFTHYIRAGLLPVSDVGLLDRLSIAAERAGVKKPVDLCVNPLVSTPLLIGFFHPCIVLPSADIPEKDFHYIVLHELTHYKRRDMFYKWLVQGTVCLHWFNPLVHLMSREITRACEFSCDEAVLAEMGDGSAQDYGRTLLDAMAAVGRYKENLGAVTLSENTQLLKERLGAIMNFKRKSTATRFLTGALTLCVALGASFVFPAAEAADQRAEASRTKEPSQEKTDTGSGRNSQMAEKYYKANSLPLFQIAFSRLDEAEQGEWLDRIYADGNISFMGAAISQLDEDCAAILDLTEKTYKDGDIAFFSALVMRMDEDMLEEWLDRALEDGKPAFQSVLFHALELDEELDEQKEVWEKEWEEAQAAEYKAAGVTIDGKNYYYQGKLVNIFLDIRPNKSFYTLDMNPEGTVNVKIVRDADNKIIGAAYITEEEVAELFEDDEDDVKIIPVNFKTVAAGETILLGEYTLSDGDEICYDIAADAVDRMKVFFAKDEGKNAVYWSVNNLRQKDEPLICSADFVVGSPAGGPGTYKLYLQAPDGALGNVKGSVFITQEDMA